MTEDDRRQLRKELQEALKEADDSTLEACKFIVDLFMSNKRETTF